MAPVTLMDAQGVDLIEELHEYFDHKGVRLVLADPSPKLARMMERSGLRSRIGEGWIFARVHDAVMHCRRMLSESTACKLDLVADSTGYDQ